MKQATTDIAIPGKLQCFSVALLGCTAADYNVLLLPKANPAWVDTESS